MRWSCGVVISRRPAPTAMITAPVSAARGRAGRVPRVTVPSGGATLHGDLQEGEHARSPSVSGTHSIQCAQGFHIL